MRKIKNKYLLISILPVLILISISIIPIMTNNMGKEITIKGNLLYNGGDTSYIEYDISKIDLEKIPKDLNKYIQDKQKSDEYIDFTSQFSKTMYVVLNENKGHYELNYASFKKPKDNVIYLKSKPSYVGYNDKKEPDYSGNIDNESPEYLGVIYTLGRNINTKQISKDVKKNFKEDKYGQPIEVSVKIKVYKGYSLLKSIY